MSLEHVDVLEQFKSKRLRSITKTIGPDMAEQILEQSLAIRPRRQVKWAQVSKVMQLMLAGRWNPLHRSHDPIRFNVDGSLPNGQHRLIAQKTLGLTIQWKIEVGCTPEDEEHDDGIRQVKTIPDRLVALSQTNRTIAKLTNDGNAWRAKNAAIIAASVYETLAREKSTFMLPDDAVSILTYFSKDALWVLDTCGSHQLTKRKAFMGAAVLAARAARVYYEDMSNLEKAVAGLKNGENVSGTTHTLREYLISLRMRDHKKRQHKVGDRRVKGDSQWIVYKKCLRALQAILSGERIRFLADPADARRLVEWFIDQDRDVLVKKLNLQPLKLLRKTHQGTT